MLDAERVEAAFDRGQIEVAPLAFMRGRTLNDSFIILDEAQNTTREQMQMFLTRLGYGSRMVVTGDITQIDLPRDQRSGLVAVPDVLEGIKDIAFVGLTGATSCAIVSSSRSSTPTGPPRSARAHDRGRGARRGRHGAARRAPGVGVRPARGGARDHGPDDRRRRTRWPHQRGRTAAARSRPTCSRSRSTGPRRSAGRPTGRRPSWATSSSAPDAAQEPLETLAVHGLLHLLGYDHERDEGEMLALQDRLVAEAP